MTSTLKRTPALLLATALLAMALLGAAAMATLGRVGRADEPAKPEVTWPGMTRAGTVLLPNGWSLKPAGKQTPLGDFPVFMAGFTRPRRRGWRRAAK